jgi:hypothetical protein
MQVLQTKGVGMENEEFDRLVFNWGNWARTRSVLPGSCRSLESRYIAPPIWYYPELRVDPDINKALMVERVLVGETFPKSSMAAIVYATVYPWRQLGGALRKINDFHPPRPVRFNNFDDFLKDSTRILFNRLRACNPENAGLYSIHNSTTANKRACHMGEVLPEEL